MGVTMTRYAPICRHLAEFSEFITKAVTEFNIEVSASDDASVRFDCPRCGLRLSSDDDTPVGQAIVLERDQGHEPLVHNPDVVKHVVDCVDRVVTSIDDLITVVHTGNGSSSTQLKRLREALMDLSGVPPEARPSF
jgi:hypothetical protein